MLPSGGHQESTHRQSRQSRKPAAALTFVYRNLTHDVQGTLRGTCACTKTPPDAHAQHNVLLQAARIRTSNLKLFPSFLPLQGNSGIFPASAIPEPLVQTLTGRGRYPRVVRPTIPVCFVLLAHWAAAYQFICLPSSSSEKLDVAQIIPHLFFLIYGSKS